MLAYLEEDGLSINSPEVGDRVTTVAATWQQLQSSITAGTQLLWNTQSAQVSISSGGASTPSAFGLFLTLLFLPGLVTDGRSQLQPGSIRQSAAPRTDHHP